VRFLDYARILGADKIATGHYVRKGEREGKATLLKGLDGAKDQSYFLHQVGHDAIADSLFPVGELEKPDVRKLASDHDFKTAGKKDSTGICFIGERRFSDFLSQYLKKNPGPIKNPEGEVIGEHEGLMYHTIGQRQGMGIGGLKHASEAPWYVADKDVESNTLWACQGNDHPALFATGLETSDIFWIAGEAPGASFRCSAKIRYRQPDQECTVTVTEAGYVIRFDNAQRAITPGQSVVLYKDDECLGGGVIETVTNRVEKLAS
jgi:tRNA-specific 2-thiouridylase